MRKSIATFLAALSCFMLPHEQSVASTLIDTSGAPNITGIGFYEAAHQIQDLADVNGPAMANALTLANIGGYPLGKSNLGGFPHFVIGITLSLGLANMKFFDRDIQRPTGYYPAFGPNPVVYAGIGLTEKFDLLIKFFYYDTKYYRPPINYSYATLSSFNLYSFGGKLRYQLAEPVTILPGLFSFGGIAIGAGADFFSGRINIDGRYRYQLGLINVNCGGGGVNDIAVDMDSVYTAETSWYIVSAGFNVLAYIDIFWVFTLYTGIGCSINVGSFRFSGIAVASAITGNTTYLTFVNPAGSIGNVNATTRNIYLPKLYLPVYIIGLDLNLIIVRISLESMVDLRNRSDVNIQVGTRTQY